MSHGGGGTLTNTLIERMFVPAFANPSLDGLHDGAVLNMDGTRLAMSTDSYVVHPWQFPGGDIGKLAIHGTVNDLCMCGATPQYLSAAFILEEGFPMADLWTVVQSMAAAAKACGISVVTGDTKVVQKGCGDGIFITTTGVGNVDQGTHINPKKVQSGDAILLSNDIGRHGMAIMAIREGLQFEPAIHSDTAPLISPVQALLSADIDVHCMRDATRGGLATTLVEIAESAQLDLHVDETSLPVSPQVRGAAEILGLDPLYIANEGCFMAFVAPQDATAALALLQAESESNQACQIGWVTDNTAGQVILKTTIGGQRVIDRLSGEQLPRIC